MCTILFSWKTQKELPLIMLANRDEFYERETRTVHFWEDHPDILAGRDMKAGGTWMGLHKNGRFAAVTNYRKFPVEKIYTTTRGDLVKNYLLEISDPEKYLAVLEAEGQQYDGFNLLFGTREQLFYFSNRSRGFELKPGIYGLSNHLLDTPWFKVKKGKKAFRKLLSDGFDDKAAFQLLNDKTQAPDDQLPDTGIGLQRERMVSSVFIESENYGTRLSTVFTINRQGTLHFNERSYVPYSESTFDL